MFGFLKDKLKKAVAAFSKNAEPNVKEEVVEDKHQIAEAIKKEPKPPRTEPVSKSPVQIVPKLEGEKVPVPPTQHKKAIPKKTSATIETPPKSKPTSTKIATPVPEKVQKKKGFFAKIFKKDDHKHVVIESDLLPEKESIADDFDKIEHDKVDETALEEQIAVVTQTTTEEPQGFFGKLKDAFTKKTLTKEKFDELFWDLEVAMLENNVAVEVIDKIKHDLSDELTTGKVNRMGLEDTISLRLRQSIEELFDVPTFDLIQKIKHAHKPVKICIIGVNGSGKTTTVAKLIYRLQQEKLSVVVAASDTFRAAAIDQLREHTEKLGVKLISQGYGADPAAVAFDAIKHAESKNIDVVLIDTAGRLHSNTNLMAELEKVVRVAKPDFKIFVGESITGNDCVEQAKVFNELVGIDAIILSKADIDEKGGAAISVSYVTGKPILFLGTGQKYPDLVVFQKEQIVNSIMQ